MTRADKMFPVPVKFTACGGKTEVFSGIMNYYMEFPVFSFRIFYSQGRVKERLE
jgi:hypothetical protein